MVIVTVYSTRTSSGMLVCNINNVIGMSHNAVYVYGILDDASI